MTARCNGCDLLYGGQSWADVVIPDDIWRKISPDGTGGGLMCFNCMNRRLTAMGLRNVPFQIASGPFSFAVRDLTGQTREATEPDHRLRKGGSVALAGVE